LKFVNNFSIFGAMLIVCGLYVVLWGKSEEMKKKNQLVPSQSSNKFGTVEIVVEDKNNHNNSNGQSQGNTLQVVKDNEDSQ
jgi:hypothetical protein